jgi:hypothetical protein
MRDRREVSSAVDGLVLVMCGIHHRRSLGMSDWHPVTRRLGSESSKVLAMIWQGRSRFDKGCIQCSSGDSPSDGMRSLSL